ncbi:hypothetical protein Hdeb2414_s0921g00961141 [Helianthus debilis subsp. tardiflorus]
MLILLADSPLNCSGIETWLTLCSASSTNLPIDDPPDHKNEAVHRKYRFDLQLYGGVFAQFQP